MSTEHQSTDIPDTLYEVTLEAGRKYWWCSCGRSRSQPFCDGSHSDTAYVPQHLVVEQNQTVWLCGCKCSANTPFCDGSHKSL